MLPPAYSLHEDRRLNRLLSSDIVERGVAPHAVAGYAQWEGTRFRFVGGRAAHSRLSQPFDLASVSKPFTAFCASLLVSEGRWQWDTPLEQVLTCARNTYAGSVHLHALLSHRSGLMPHVQLFRPTFGHHSISRPRALRRAADAHDPANVGRAVYSDLGYLLIGEAISESLGMPLDHALANRIFVPFGLDLGSARAHRRANPRFWNDVAPTEVHRARGGLLRGVVHDDNAWVLGGTGCCGHAGLFGDLLGLLRFGAGVLAGLSDERVRGLLEPLVRARPGGTLRMGFDGVGPHSSAGTRASPTAFGHLGYTGTSLWIDPARGRAIVLLTNRVYPTRARTTLSAVRPQIHDFLWEC